MLETSDHLRDRRRALAAPGGRHDKRVAFLMTALPATVGMLVAAMVLTPLFPRHEVSFLLDRNKVAITRERLQVTSAVYRGMDDKGRGFSVQAGNAVQHSARVQVVQMRDLMARLDMSEGPAEVTAGKGSYDMGQELLDIDGPVVIRNAQGYRIATSDVRLDLKSRRAVSRGAVAGVMPQGQFAAQHMTIDLAQRSIALDGRAHLRMKPSASLANKAL
jgi:lipopolysaccharide export system protein LptC